jgi:uncharacterized protein (AIM24 family)
MTDVSERIACRWCKGQSPATARTCERCGAPLDVRDLVTDSGWREAPKLRDLTEIQFGASRCQIDGTVVPVADVDLAPGDWVYFEHHVMLWKEDRVPMSVMDTPGGMKRIFAGLPFVLSVARGPGRVSFSRDAPGELVVLPIDPGMEVDVREHAMVLASGWLSFSFEQIQGLKTMLAAGGMYLDRYVASDHTGLLVLHGFGNVFQRTLDAGQSIQVEPGGFLYKDSTVTMEVSTQKLTGESGGGAGSGAGAGSEAGGGSEAAGGAGGAGGATGTAAKSIASRGFAGLKAARSLMKGGNGLGGLLSAGGLQAAAGVLTGPGLTLMRLTGPGRVGIQSMYRHHETA